MVGHQTNRALDRFESEISLAGLKSLEHLWNPGPMVQPFWARIYNEALDDQEPRVLLSWPTPGNFCGTETGVCGVCAANENPLFL
jgi:hypothetical protein